MSAHRTPDWLFKYAETARERGLRVIIAGAGGAAHLPGMLASKTLVPVLGVPVSATQLNGLDSLLQLCKCPRAFPSEHWQLGSPAPPTPHCSPLKFSPQLTPHSTTAWLPGAPRGPQK